MLKPIEFPSPNKKYKAIMTYISESQADQTYCSLSIDGFPHSFADRVFGRTCLWSPESRFLVVQEWKATDDASSPELCQLLVIDLVSRRECIIANVEGTKGNILPEGFIGESLMYSVIYYGQFGMTKSYESKFQYLEGWHTLK